MKITNKKTGKDITNHVIEYLEKKITKSEFESKANLKVRQNHEKRK